MLLELLTRARERSGLAPSLLLQALGVPDRTYRRWRETAAGEGQPETAEPAVGCRRGRQPGAPPTPDEVLAVTGFARRHPQMGYKRLTWLMVSKGIAALRPYQVRDVLRERGLIVSRPAPSQLALKRPLPPERPDQVWHLDLMYVGIGERWFYLVDILDGYSRFLVHWSLNPTMRTDTVTLTMQQALEKLTVRETARGTERRAGEPQLVHDHGSQFVSAEWKGFVSAVGSRDIRTRVAHPESNGKLERLHRTHREEGLAGQELQNYHDALRALERWASYYNEERPHSALKYLAPAVYYRGDPEAHLKKRAERLDRGAAAREAYWESRPP